MDLVLITLPCGCVADVRSLPEAEEGYILCPWCTATFCGIDFHDWCVAGLPTIYIQQPRPLFTYADQLLEIVSRCGGCGEFIVRKYGERDEVHMPEHYYAHPLRN